MPDIKKSKEKKITLAKVKLWYNNVSQGEMYHEKKGR